MKQTEPDEIPHLKCNLFPYVFSLARISKYELITPHQVLSTRNNIQRFANAVVGKSQPEDAFLDGPHTRIIPTKS